MSTNVATLARASAIRWSAVTLLLGAVAACGRSTGQVEDLAMTPAAGRPNGSGGAGAAAGGRSNGGTPAGTEAGAAGSPDEPERGFVELDGTPLYTRVPRLTVSQWERAVTDILRFPASQNLSQAFQRPSAAFADFDNNEKLLYVDATNILDFETGAEAAAALATGSPEALAALYDGDDAAGFVRTLGLRTFRRPLDAAEEAAYGAIFTRGEELYGAGFANGAALVIRAMLQSPHFLYRTELGPAGEALNAYELASKLSFSLLGTTPSDSLLEAVASGALDSDDGLEAAAREMLDAPAATAVLRDFHRQLFTLAGAGLSGEHIAASLEFFDLIYESELGLREIFTSKQAYVGVELAPIYGVTAPASGLALRELARRSGYFLQVPFLTRGSDGRRSNPSQRGLGLQRMLCGPLPAAHETPPSVAPQPPDQTTRHYVTTITEPCGGTCHTAIDPLGFALENFDGLGWERVVENGSPVDTASSYPFAEGVEPFVDAIELMRILADSMQAHTCYSKNVTGYALGRDVAPSDRPLLEALGRTSLSSSLRELVLALVRDPAFRSRPEVKP